MTDAAGASPRSWPLHKGEPPFVHLSWRDGAAVMTGDARAALGTNAAGAAGVSAGWVWDGARLAAQVDPLGFFSLFVYEKAGTLALSPSILQLIALGADCAPDTRARALFDSLGLFVNQDTPFRHIRVLPAGGHLSWVGGRAEISGGEFVPPQQDLSRDAAVDGLVDLTRDSLGRIGAVWAGDFLLPLSGGRDSRHILLALDHLGRLPRAAITFQHHARGLSAEAQSARALCDSLGIEHVVLDAWRRPAHDIVRAMTLTSLCSDEHVQMMALHDMLAGSSAAVPDGVAGDILTNPDDDAAGHFERAQRGDFAGIARAMIAGHAGVISRPGRAGAAVPPAVAEEAADYLGATIARYGDAADPYQAFWFWNRTRREISFVASALFAGAAAVFCPFLDRRLVEFGLSLPFAVTRDQMLHDDAIRRGYPRQAGIPYAEGFRDPPGGRRGIARYLGDMAVGARMVRHLRPRHPAAEMLRHVTGAGPLWRRPAEVRQFHRLALAAMDAGLARWLLDTDARLRGPGGG